MSFIEGFVRDPNARTASYYAETEHTTLKDYHIEKLKRVCEEEQGTARLCLHTGPGSTLHEMVIVQPRGQFYPPKKNLTKPKSFTILEGCLLVFTFSDDGSIKSFDRLQAGRQITVRLAPGEWHCDISYSPRAMHLEALPGPFLGSAQEHVLAPWGPAIDDKEAMLQFHLRMMDQAFHG